MNFPFQPNLYNNIPQQNNLTSSQYENMYPAQQFCMQHPHNPLIERLRDELPPTFTRQYICEKLGGLLAPKTLANLDSLREGPECKLRIGKKIGYERDDFLAWFEKRIKKQ